jgi:alpha-amylase
VFVHLFEWRWSDIARECEEFLGPKSYAAVQISPPSEHAVISSTTTGVSYPWWQRYQTVSYRLDRSRSGTLAEFTDMVSRCRAVGVDIYVDAVINHMTAGSGTGSAGGAYSKYSYPPVPYGSGDFHSSCSVGNYQDAANVQNCELVGLADLKTESENVRGKIAAYLIGLNELGVRGFRIDAAKHVPPADLDAIMARVNAAAAAAGRPLPYVFLEVINNAGEAVTAQQYYGVGYASGGAADITEFQYGYRVSDAFLGRNGATLAGLQDLGSSLLPSDKAVVFTDNHDNQRGNNIYYVDGAGYELALVYTLAQPHGYPSLMSSYGFDRGSPAGRDAGPPSDAGGVTQTTFDDAGNSRCTASFGAAGVGTWVCEHRRASVARMVQLRRYAAGAPLGNWQALGTPNQVGFTRAGRAFVALNRESNPASNLSVQTGLPAGTYCDVVSGEVNGTQCTGAAIAVAANGTALINLPARGAVAIHGGAVIQ